MESKRVEWKRDSYRISDSRQELDLEMIHGFLCESYWAKGIPRTILEKSIDNSLCVGLYQHNKQIGFARLITDRATFAYLADVFILPKHRGQGLGKWFIRTILEHPDLQGLRRVLLATKNAHGLYEQNGFLPVKHPEWFMEILHSNIYPKPK
ncbi:MAG: GNAT family N-acetyltransferase [Gammaproteobacteria bacterium]|nr:GNAT family N-acetyltransferase [Gammaproteobacteria bacterium]